jgi:hypothetical protein
MRGPFVVAALVTLASCSAASTPVPVATPQRQPLETTSTVLPSGAENGLTARPEASGGDSNPTPSMQRSGAGTFGAGVWEPDFRHTGETRRHRSYLIFDDGRFEHRVDGYDHLPTLACTFRDPVAYGGSWRRDGGDLVLRVTWEDHVRGGHRVESPLHGCLDEGGTFIRSELRIPREERISLGACAAGFLYPEAPCISLNGAPWYRTSPEGSEPRAAWYAWCDTLPPSQRPGICTQRR